MTGFVPHAQPALSVSWVAQGLLLAPLLFAVLLMHGLQCGSGGTHDQLAVVATGLHHHAPDQHPAEASLPRPAVAGPAMDSARSPASMSGMAKAAAAATGPVTEASFLSEAASRMSVDRDLADLASPDKGPGRDRPGPGHLLQVCFALLVGGIAIAAVLAGALGRATTGRPTGPASSSGRPSARRAPRRPPDLLQLCVSRT